MENPKVSIVLPTYNRIEWLVKSIESVRKQTYQNWELFVIDDISSDGTDSKMLEFCNIDSRIKYFKLPVTEEVGISKFLNFGINNGSGKYIARLDDDDKWIDCDKLKKQVEFMESHIGEEFEGVISGITTWGMYVELSNTVEGMVHVSNLPGDYFNYNEETYEMVGEKTGRTYKLGEKIRVTVKDTDKTSRRIDFSILE